MKGIRSNPNHVLCISAVLLIAILCQSSSAESPALAYIAKDFPQYPFSTISYVTTLPSLAMIAPSLLYPWLRRHFTVRQLFVVGSILLVGCGVAPAYCNSFVTVCIWRFFFGVGMGIMWPLAQSTIVELYEGTRRDTLLGFYSVIVAMGGVVWANVGGVLALQGWRVAFYTYYIPLIVLTYSFIFLPYTTRTGVKDADAESGEPEAQQQPGDEPIEGWVSAAVFLLLAFFCMNFVSGTYFTNLSVKVVDEGIGNSASSGFAQSMFTFGSLIIGLTFGIVMRLKFVYRYSMPIAWTIGNIGFFIVAFSHTLPVLCIGSVIQGFGTGMFVPSCLNLVSRIGGKQKAPLLVGLSCALSGLSQFAGPTLTNLLAEALGLAHGSPTMFLAAAIDFVTMVICWCIYIPKSAKVWKAQAAAAEQVQAVQESAS